MTHAKGVHHRFQWCNPTPALNSTLWPNENCLVRYWKVMCSQSCVNRSTKRKNSIIRGALKTALRNLLKLKQLHFVLIATATQGVEHVFKFFVQLAVVHQHGNNLLHGLIHRATNRRLLRVRRIQIRIRFFDTVDQLRIGNPTAQVK